MRKALLAIIVVTAAFCSQPSAAQVNNGVSKGQNAEKISSALVDSATFALRRKDTVSAVADIKSAEAYIPALSATAALSLKNKITGFYIAWVNLKNPPSRGRPDDRSIEISKLTSQLTTSKAELTHQSVWYNDAAKLAVLAKIKPFYIYAKTGYAESLVSAGRAGLALPVLDSLADEPSLSDYEQMHLLSLLVINTVKLNSSKNLDRYYTQLQAVNKQAAGKMDRQEYLLATAMYLQNRQDYTRAINKYHALLSLHNDKAPYSEPMAEGMVGLAGAWGKLHRTDSADYYFQKANEIISQQKDLRDAAIQYRLAYSSYLQQNGKVYKAAGKVQAEDTAYRSRLKSATQQLELKYRLAIKQQQVKLLAQQQQLQLLTYMRDRQRSIVITLGLIVIIIAATAFSLVLFQRRRQQQVLHAVEVERLQRAHQLEVMNVLAKAQEEERNRIAGQLHDEVGSMLAVARLNLSAIEGDGGKAATVSTAQLQAANSILGDVATTIREMSHELMPVAIRQLGLKKSVLQLIDDINAAHQIRVQAMVVGLEDDTRFPVEFQTNIYRIIQELFHNIIKHSEATHASFQLVEHPDALNIMVEDNGQGVDAEAYKRGKGASLLASRVDLYHGALTLETTGTNGTLIIIDIPLQNIVYSGLKNDPGFLEDLPR